MIQEAVILLETDLLPVPRERIEIWGRSKGDVFKEEHFQSYYPVYAALAARYDDLCILEIGVRFGFTAFAMLWAAISNSKGRYTYYLGLDNESYVPDSNYQAKSYLTAEFPDLHFKIRNWDTADGLPIMVDTFDLIHIDGDHSYEGALRDMRLSWSVLNPGGVIIVDDQIDPEVNRAIKMFLAERAEDLSCKVQYQFLEPMRGHCLLRRGEALNGC